MIKSIKKSVIHLCKAAIVYSSLTLISGIAFASSVDISVFDHKGKPLSDAVITLKPLDTEVAAVNNEQINIAQINKEFVPHVSVVRVGTEINFPNQDSIGHHVYSFSKAKTFDLPLYQGTLTKPVVFDTPGLVTLGCNIHDWMRAHVVIVDTPYYQLSDNTGGVSLKDIPDGEYELEVWHSRQRKSFVETVVIDATFSRKLVIKTKPKLRSRRNSSGSSRKYNG